MCLSGQRQIIYSIQYSKLMVGENMRRVCVATTHIVSNGSKGFRKLGQVEALISAAEALMKDEPSVPLS